MVIKRSAHSDASSLEPHSSLQYSASCSMTKNTIPDVVGGESQGMSHFGFSVFPTSNPMSGLSAVPRTWMAMSVPAPLLRKSGSKGFNTHHLNPIVFGMRWPRVAPRRRVHRAGLEGIGARHADRRAADVEGQVLEREDAVRQHEGASDAGRHITY